jgi:hypothetical protein
MILDIKCNNNSNLLKIKDMCFQIEKSIKRGDIDIVILEIKNVLLPLLDKLTNEEMQIEYQQDHYMIFLFRNINIYIIKKLCFLIVNIYSCTSNIS